VAKEIPADEKLTERLTRSLKELNSGLKNGPQTEILSGRSLVRLSGTSIFRMPEKTKNNLFLKTTSKLRILFWPF